MRISREMIAVVAASIVVVLVIGLGFWKTRGPGAQRLLRADEVRLRSLGQLAAEIHEEYSQQGKQLPSGLSSERQSKYKDPVTGTPPEYIPNFPSKYTLCMTFATNSDENPSDGVYGFWSHPIGRKCFELDASQFAPQVPYFAY